MLKVLKSVDLTALGTQGPALDVMGVNSEWLINGNEPANKALKVLLNAAPDPTLLKGKRVAVIVTDGVEEIELTFVRKILIDRGAEVHIISPKKPSYPPMFGAYVPANRDQYISTVKWMQNSGYIRIDKFLGDVYAKDYHLVYIPGGSWNPDAIRADQEALSLIKAANDKNITIASLCHGPWVLISAGLVKGKHVTAWWSMHDDLKNAGGTVVDKAVVKDGNIITSRSPVDLAPFTEALIDALMKN